MSHQVYGRGHCGVEGCHEPVALKGTGGEAELWSIGPVDKKTKGETYIRPITTDKDELCYWHKKQHKLMKIKLNYKK